MTEVLYSPKIKPEHLARKAIVYLRQSSERQVRQNKESQQLQYAVADRVRALGWKQVEIINSDLGSSAGIASAQREGFERVLSSVALGEVGIVASPWSACSKASEYWICCRVPFMSRQSYLPLPIVRAFGHRFRLGLSVAPPFGLGVPH